VEGGGRKDASWLQQSVTEDEAPDRRPPPKSETPSYEALRSPLDEPVQALPAAGFQFGLTVNRRRQKIAVDIEAAFTVGLALEGAFVGLAQKIQPNTKSIALLWMPDFRGGFRSTEVDARLGEKPCLVDGQSSERSNNGRCP